jgi:PTS system mannose-specific IIC component
MFPTDIPMFFEILLLAFFGGLIGLDRTAVGQFMISQPLVAGPLTGWLLGDVSAGLIIGVALELIWVLDLPVGSFVPANSTVSAVFATSAAILGSHGPASLSVIGFSLLLTAALAQVTIKADYVVRTWNARLVAAAESGKEPDAGRRLFGAHLFGVVFFFLKSFLLYLIILPLGVVAVLLFQRFPEEVHRAMSLFVQLLPLLGVAVIAHKLSIRMVDAFFFIGFVIAALLTQVFHAPGLVIVPLTIMGGLLRAGYAERQ